MKLKKQLSLLLCGAMMVSALAGCGNGGSSSSASGSDSASGSQSSSSVGDTSQSDAYTLPNIMVLSGPTGVGAAKLMADNEAAEFYDKVAASATVEADNQAVSSALINGDADIAAVATNVAATLVNKNPESIQVLAVNTLGVLYILEKGDTVTSMADLAGKNVSIGAVGSGVYFNALDVLGAYDLTEEDITPQYQDFATSVDSLKDGKIDAAFIVAGAPTTAVVDLASGNDVYLVSLDDEHIDKLIASSPYYSKNVIAADVYGTPEDCTTVAISAVLIGRADLDPDVAYTIVYTLFQNADKISHAKAAELSLEFGASVSDVPYNEGAARYFEEQGFTVPTA